MGSKHIQEKASGFDFYLQHFRAATFFKQPKLGVFLP